MQNKDILAQLGTQKTAGQILCGFSMETEHMVENSRVKLEQKNLDLIVANNLNQKGAGFGGDTNIVTAVSYTHLDVYKRQVSSILVKKGDTVESNDVLATIA